MGDPLSDEEVGELFRSPMTSTTETEAAVRLRFEVTRARREESRLRDAATLALAVLTRLADSAAYWSDYDVPVGIVAEIDAAKARLAGALSREARP